MNTVTTLTPKESRFFVRAVRRLSAIADEMEKNGAAPKRRKRKAPAAKAVPAPAPRGPARTRAGKNPLANVAD